MATPTYTPLASTTLSSSASSVTFSSIPQTYGDLILTWDVDISATTGQIILRFSGDTGANYSRVQMRGDGSAAASFAADGATQLFAYSSPYDKFWGNIQIMDYSATDKHKTGLIRNDNVGEFTVALASRWANTSAVTSIEVFTDGETYLAGSTFSLYGVAK